MARQSLQERRPSPVAAQTKMYVHNCDKCRYPCQPAVLCALKMHTTELDRTDHHLMVWRHACMSTTC